MRQRRGQTVYTARPGQGAVLTQKVVGFRVEPESFGLSGLALGGIQGVLGSGAVETTNTLDPIDPKTLSSAHSPEP